MGQNPFSGNNILYLTLTNNRCYSLWVYKRKELKLCMAISRRDYNHSGAKLRSHYLDDPFHVTQMAAREAAL